jgi:nicotinamidase-related amidase
MHAINLPKPAPVSLRADKSAVLVLDGSARWGNPELPCHKLVPGMRRFLDRARDAGLPIIYTVSYRRRGTPEGEVYSGLARKPSEPVIFPDSFDKFAGGQLQTYLNFYGAESLVITGYRANICVLHTATTAARELKYRVVIPVNGIAALSPYEQDYTLFHFSVLPKQAAELFAFTTLEMISFEATAAD